MIIFLNKNQNITMIQQYYLLMQIKKNCMWLILLKQKVNQCSFKFFIVQEHHYIIGKCP